MKKLFLIIFLTSFLISGLAHKYQRIISLVPSITQELYLLGEEKNLIACTTFCIIPGEAKKKDKIGNVINLNLEKILILNPDIILAGDYTAKKYLDSFQKFNLKTVSFKTPSSFDDICHGFLKLGNILKKQDQAQEYLDKIIIQLNKIRNLNSNKTKITIGFLLGTHPLFWATSDSYLNDCIKYAGGQNLLQDYKMGQISREEIVSLKPEIILFANMGINTKNEMENWKNFHSIPAVKNNKLFIVDPNIFCLPSPKNFLLSVIKLQQFIINNHSDIKK